MKALTTLTTLALATAASQGAYTYTGTNFTENFDGLPTTNITNVFSATVGSQAAISGTGFVGTKIAGTGTAATPLTADNGAGSSGAIYSYGATSNAERSLGLVASGTNIMAFGLEIINGGTFAITQITVSFTQENWRTSTSAVNTMTAATATTGAAGVTSANFLSSTSVGFSLVSALNLVGPAIVASNGAIDGNLTTNQVARTATFSGLSIAPGNSFYVRWQDANDAGNDAGLAIDNLSLTIVPEPASVFLGSFGLLGLLRRRR